jgi:hypothetical protein
MPKSVAIAGVVVAVLAIALGGWFVVSRKDSGTAGASGQPAAAPTTRLSVYSYPSGTPTAQPYPTVPEAQLTGDGRARNWIRTRANGRQLLVPLADDDCSREEARLLGEYGDRVEVEIHPLPMPLPSGATPGPDGTYAYGCMTMLGDNNLYAIIDLHDPLGARKVSVHTAYAR